MFRLHLGRGSPLQYGVVTYCYKKIVLLDLISDTGTSFESYLRQGWFSFWRSAGLTARGGRKSPEPLLPLIRCALID